MPLFWWGKNKNKVCKMDRENIILLSRLRRPATPLSRPMDIYFLRKETKKKLN